MSDIETDFEQLSPLADDIMQHVARLQRSAYERAAVASMLLTRMSVSAAQTMLEALHSGEQVSAETSLQVAKVLSDHTARASAVIDATSEKYAVALNGKYQ